MQFLLQIWELACSIDVCHCGWVAWLFCERIRVQSRILMSNYRYMYYKLQVQFLLRVHRCFVCIVWSFYICSSSSELSPISLIAHRDFPSTSTADRLPVWWEFPSSPQVAFALCQCLAFGCMLLVPVVGLERFMPWLDFGFVLTDSFGWLLRCMHCWLLCHMPWLVSVVWLCITSQVGDIWSWVVDA